MQGAIFIPKFKEVYMTLLKIGKTILPAPQSYRVDSYDIDSSDTGRSEDGTMKRNRIATKYKIQAAWTVSQENLQTIISAVSPETFSVAFFDPTTGAVKTKTMYAGDRSSEMVVSQEVNGENWWKFSVNFVEV